MPQDAISDWIANEESFYSDVQGLLDKWVEEGDAWHETSARKEAEALIRHIAEAIENFDFVDDKYSEREIREAVDEVLEQFEEHKEEAIKAAVEEGKRKPKPEDLVMDEGEKEHAKKYEALAQKLGVESLRALMPVSAQKIRAALERGDKHLNSISLRKWDAAGTSIRGKGLSMAEKVCVLKHVAKWHYA